MLWQTFYFYVCKKMHIIILSLSLCFHAQNTFCFGLWQWKNFVVSTRCLHSQVGLVMGNFVVDNFSFILKFNSFVHGLFLQIHIFGITETWCIWDLRQWNCPSWLLTISQRQRDSRGAWWSSFVCQGLYSLYSTNHLRKSSHVYQSPLLINSPLSIVYLPAPPQPEPTACLEVFAIFVWFSPIVKST